MSYLLSVLSGLLLTLGFPSTDLYYLSWGALLPLFLAIRNKDGRQSLSLGYLCGLAHFLTVLHWIRYVIYHYGGLPLPAAVGVLVLLCGYLAVYPAVFAYVAHRWQDRPFLWLLGLPCVWVTLEWIRAHAVTGFPWTNLGYSQSPLNVLVQTADLTGVYGLSWLVVLGNTTLSVVLEMGRFRRAIVVTGVCVLAASLGAAIVYGTQRIAEVDRLQGEARPWTVGVVQGNVDQSLKWEPSYQKATMEKYRGLSLKAAAHQPKPELIVWPETAAPFFYGIEEEQTRDLNAIFQEVGIPVLFGSPGIRVADGQSRLQNRAYLTSSDAGLIGFYAKQHLVPFGEYVPLQQVLFFVHRLVQAAGDFVPGNNPAPMVLNGRRFGVLICYEDIFPALARAAIRLEATALVNITNDAWFGTTSAPYQHLEMGRWRAVEFRVPMIRSANTGISALFDAAGRPCGLLPLNQEGFLVCTLRPFSLPTFYATWGDLFAWGCVVATVVGGLCSFRRKRGPVA